MIFASHLAASVRKLVMSVSALLVLAIALDSFVTIAANARRRVRCLQTSRPGRNRIPTPPQRRSPLRLPSSPTETLPRSRSPTSVQASTLSRSIPAPRWIFFVNEDQSVLTPPSSPSSSSGWIRSSRPNPLPPLDPHQPLRSNRPQRRRCNRRVRCPLLLVRNLCRSLVLPTSTWILM